MQVSLVRNDADATPWGFRLQGGAEKNQPITIYRIAANSIAERHALQIGDVLESLGGLSLRGSTLQEVQDRIKQSGNVLDLVLLRNDASSANPTSPSYQAKLPPPPPQQSYAPNTTFEDAAGASSNGWNAYRPMQGQSSNQSQNQNHNQNLYQQPQQVTTLNRRQRPTRQYGRQNSNPVYGTNYNSQFYPAPQGVNMPWEGAYTVSRSQRRSETPRHEDTDSMMNYYGPYGYGSMSRNLRATSLQPSECSLASGSVSMSVSGRSSAQSPALDRIRKQSEVLKAIMAEEAHQRVRKHSNSVDVTDSVARNHADWQRLPSSFPTYQPPPPPIVRAAPMAPAPASAPTPMQNRVVIDDRPQFKAIRDSCGLATDPLRQSKRFQVLNMKLNTVDKLASEGRLEEVFGSGEYQASAGAEMARCRQRNGTSTGNSDNVQAPNQNQNQARVGNSRQKTQHDVSASNEGSEIEGDDEDGHGANANDSIGNYSEKSIRYKGTRNPSKSFLALQSIMKVPTADLTCNQDYNYLVNKTRTRADVRRRQREGKHVAINPRAQVVNNAEKTNDRSHANASANHAGPTTSF